MSNNIHLAELNKEFTSYKRCKKEESKLERINNMRKIFSKMDSQSGISDEILTLLGQNNNSNSSVPKINYNAILPKLDVFDSIELMTEVVYSGKSNGLLVIGMGGVGKTETIMRKTKRLATTNDKQIFRITSSMTAPALYQKLFENRNNLIIVDDCDDMIKDLKCISLLKNAMDTSVNRYVQWNAKTGGYYNPYDLNGVQMSEEEMQDLYDATIDSKVVSLPNCFEFRGQIIIISNITLEKFKDKALLTRVSSINVNLNREQLKKRLYDISENFDTNLSMDEFNKVLDYMFYVVDNFNVPQEVNIRTFKHSLAIYETHQNKTNTIEGKEYETWKLLINEVLAKETID